MNIGEFLVLGRSLPEAACIFAMDTERRLCCSSFVLGVLAGK